MDPTTARARLDRRRSELLTRYRNGVERADEELQTPEAELVERATEQHDAEVLSAIGDVELAALADVLSAMVRVEAGTYGICTVCEEPIAERRLASIPEVATCISCARFIGRDHHHA